MIYLRLFYIFFKIGLFGFGGGYAMISLIENEVVEKNQFMTHQEFADLLAISQSTPGPISINCATYLGFKVVYSSTNSLFLSICSSIISTFALCLPSILMFLILLYLFRLAKFKNKVQDTIKYVKLCVCALIFYSATSLIGGGVFVDIFSYLIFFVVLFLNLRSKISPILFIVSSAILGLIIY